ncbi:large subunit ribosomal protein L11 [Mycoplasmoides fastidiosum]|uniref:Large ribosomal subunit protein uL11 n=1 Tax=Mycoplasmoides fastidiosum TaxID=92758 RepID=A0ABU0LZF6_9BACT|nr:50S ribosomal protein L11 [Mycoplasmoides fastidiosum]MDQ0514081.1 large subunit ribosomal protein L11 [Mycoplasmoides fastidiosum]UUD37509.1 50S ribosomal protein L11 [Mycoplasmoides fastidiosum]
MAAKKINRIAKLELIGGQAKPGPALASVGINMGEFTKQFNDRTKDRNGDVVPTIITAYTDKSFIFEVKTTPTTILLKKAAGIEKGAKVPNKEKVGKISKEKALEIAKYKLVDANARDEEAMLRMVAGTAKQMGLEIEGFDPIKPKKAKGF